MGIFAALEGVFLQRTGQWTSTQWKGVFIFRWHKLSPTWYIIIILAEFSGLRSTGSCELNFKPPILQPWHTPASVVLLYFVQFSKFRPYWNSHICPRRCHNMTRRDCRPPKELEWRTKLESQSGSASFFTPGFVPQTGVSRSLTRWTREIIQTRRHLCSESRHHRNNIPLHSLLGHSDSLKACLSLGYCPGSMNRVHLYQHKKQIFTII